MKNILNYFYNIYAENIRLNGDNYYFNYKNESYVFYLYNDNYKELEKIYEIYTQMLKRGIYSHQIILNKDNQISTIYNQKQYVLLKISIKPNTKITINDILYFGNITEGYKNIINWKNLWSSKIDYFEYQMLHFGKKYQLIRNSFSYYAGIVENGIILLNEKKDVISSISHKRILNNETILEFYNPLNYIIDIKVRDAAEYFKNKLLTDKNVFEDIKNYLSISKLNENEVYYFFVRMFYPSFYFDCYEKVINGILDEYKIKEVIEITPYYENLLKGLYQYLKKYIQIPEIEWLNRI
mgnify:FL=1